MRIDEHVDGRRAWFVLMMCFLNQAILGGCMYSIGTVLLVLLQPFPSQTFLASFAGALLSSVLNFLAPIAGVLADKLTCRGCMMLGGVLASMGFMVSAFVSDIRIIVFTLGVVVAFGLALMCIPSQSLIGFNFLRHRQAATGFALSGCGWGVLLVTTVVNLAAETYGWRGMLLLLGALCLQSIVASYLCYPSLVEKIYRMNPDFDIADIITEKKYTNVLENGDSKTGTLSDYDELRAVFLAEKSNSKNKSIQNLPQTIKEFSSRLRILMTKKFTVLNYTFFTFGFAASIPMLYIPLYALECGVSDTVSAWIMLIVGVCLIITRGLVGPVIGRFGHAEIWNLSALILWCTMTFIYPFVSFYTHSHLAFAIAFGLFSTPVPVFLNMLTIELFGIRTLSIAFGVLMMFGGLGFLLGPLCAGVVISSTNSVRGTFFLSGGVLLVAIIVNILANHIFGSNEPKEETVTVVSLNPINIARSNLSLSGTIGNSSLLQICVTDGNGEVIPWSKADSLLISEKSDLRLSVLSLHGSKRSLSAYSASAFGSSMFGSQPFRSRLNSHSTNPSMNTSITKINEFPHSPHLKNVKYECSPLALVSS